MIQARGNSDPDNYTAKPETIKNILTCFLVGTDCELFQSVLTHDRAQELGENTNQCFQFRCCTNLKMYMYI